MTALDEHLCKDIHAAEWYAQFDPGQTARTAKRLNARTEPCIDCQRTALSVSEWILTKTSVIAEAAVENAAGALSPAPLEVVASETVAIRLAREARP